MAVRRDHRPYGLHRLQHRWNQWWAEYRLKPQLDACGHGLSLIGGRFVYASGSNIHLGHHVHMMALAEAPIRLSVFEGMGQIRVDDHVLINPGVRIVSADRVEIGSNCMLAMHCHITDADWHDQLHRIFAPGETAPVIIGNNVWLGDSVKVLKGVTIGDNTIVGAGAVVTKNLPSNVIAAGNPARIIKSLETGGGTTREALFTMAEPYEAFAEAFVKDRLRGNTFLDWLRSLVLPGPKD